MTRRPRPALRTRGAGLWVRGALRRPGRGLLVVLGLLAMHVATVASLVGGSALERLFVEDARAQWGPIDVVTFRPGEPLISESLVRFAATEGAQLGDRWAGRLILDAVASGGPGQREPDARLLGVSADEIDIGAPMTGEGQTDPLLLGPDGVLLGRRLADRIDVGTGDRVGFVVAIPEHTDPDDEDLELPPRVVRWDATVEGIADDTGLVDFGRTPNALTRLDTLQRITGLPGLVSALYLDTPDDGRDAAEAVTEGFESINRRVGLVSVEAKEDALDLAADEGGLFSGILLTLALLVVAASAAVTVNLIVLLGQERAREVAVMRAIGVAQRHVRRLFVAEAAVYALLAAVVGVALALPLAGWLATTIADHFGAIEAGRGRELVDLDLTPDPAAIVSGIVTVLVVALVTAWSAGRRLAGLDVADVLRGGPPVLGTPDRGERRLAVTRGVGLLTLGMGLTAGDGGDLLRYVGVSLLLVAWWLHLRHRLPAGAERTRLDERAAVVGLVWSVVAPALLGDFAAGVQASFGILVLAGVGAVSCATVLATARAAQLMRVVRLYLPDRRGQAPLRTAGSWAGHLRSRGGTVTGTVGVVLFMVAALAVLGSATDIGVARQRGGYDVVGTSAVRVDPDQLSAVRGVRRVDAMDHTLMGEGWFTTEDEDDEASSVPYPVRAIRLDPGFAAAQAFALADALPEYTSAGQVLDDVVRGEGVVLDRYARPEGAVPGDDVVVDDGRGPVSHELLAVLDTYLLQGVLMGPDAYEDLFATRGPTFVIAAANDGHDADALAGELNEAAAEVGLDVVTVAEAAREVVAVNRTFTDTFAVMLRLALGVALVGVAVLVARAVRERRSQLAVLRAIGFTRRDVTLALVAEPMLQAVTGVVIGVVAGLGVLWLLFRRGFADLAFVVGWVDLGLTCAAVLGLVLLSSLVPAVRGARGDVAAGLRDQG